MSSGGKRKPKFHLRILQKTSTLCCCADRAAHTPDDYCPPDIADNERSSTKTESRNSSVHGRPAQSISFAEKVTNRVQVLRADNASRSTLASLAPVVETFKGGAKIVWDGFRLLSSKVEKLFEGTPFRIPVAALNTLLEIANAVGANDSALQTKLDQIGDRLSVLNQALRDPRSKATRDRCEELCSRLVKIEEEITAMKKRGILERVAESQEDLKVLQDLLDVISRATEDFHLHVSLSIEQNMEDLKDIIRKQRLDNWLSLEAIYDSADIPRAACTAGTCESALKKIRNWAYDPSSPCIFWLAGRAGTGKSTIAYTIAEEFDRKHSLGASFFCSRQLTEAKKRLSIVPSVASLLARVFFSYRDALLKQDIGPILRQPNKQIENMIVKPWIDAGRPENFPSVLIVIDALDELEPEDHKSAGAKFIQQLIEHADKLSGLKFLISSRHEPDVVKHCKALEAFYHLEDVDAREMRRDIETYLVDALPELRDPQQLVYLSQLVDQSDGLFIYAATAARFVHVTDVPSRRLELLRLIAQGWPRLEEQESEGLAVDNVYHQVLKSALPNANTPKRRMLSILSTILCVQEPLTASTVAKLLQVQDKDINEAVVKDTIQKLHAVLREDNVNGYIYTYHKSFQDYMLNSQRCGEDVVCKPHEQNFLLAKSCFQIMTTGLRFNICDLPSSFLLDEEVTDLGERMKERIGTGLRYASRYWASHAVATLRREEPTLDEFALQCRDELLKCLRVFCNSHLLFWMETMNLIGFRGECSESLSNVRSALATTMNVVSISFSNDLQAAENFATSFASNPVSKSTPHLYISILPVYKGHSALLQTWKHNFRRLPVLEGQRKMERVLSIFHPKRLVFSLDISSDGKSIAAGVEDGTVYVWDSTTGKEKLKLEGHSACVTSVSFSFDSKFIVSVSWDGRLCVWDSLTGDEKLKLSGHNDDHEVKAISFSPDDNRDVPTADDPAKLFTSIGEKERARRLHDNLAWAASFSPDGKCVVSGVHDRTVRVWDSATGHEKLKLDGHNGAVTAASFSPNGKYILSASSDKTLRMWDAVTGIEERKLEGHSREVTAASFSPDGKRIVSAANDRTVRLWSVTTGKEELKLMIHAEYVVAASFSPDGKRIVSAAADSSVRIFDAITGEEELALGHNSVVMTALYSHDGKRIVSASEDRTVRVWDATGKSRSTEDLKGHRDVVTTTSFSKDGKLIVSASWDRTVRVWDAASGKEVLVMDHKDKVWGASFSQDGRHIITGSQDGTVQVWDAMTGAAELNLEGHSDFVWDVSFSPDGKYAVSSSFDRTIRVWDVAAGKEHLRLMGHDHKVKAVSFSPDGRRIVSASFDMTVRVWDAGTGKEILRMNHSDLVWAASFSPDGKRIVSGSEGRAARVWDAMSGKEEVTLKGHSGSVRNVSWSQDGKQIVSASHDGTVRVWDVATGKEEFKLLFGHDVHVTAASFSPDGKYIVSCADDSTVRLWDVVKASVQSWTVDNDGWIVSPQAERLMWVPSDIVQILQQPHCRLINSPYGSVSVDFANGSLGKQWSDCYTQA